MKKGQGRRAGAGTAKSQQPKKRGVQSNAAPQRDATALSAADANPQPSSLDRLASLFGGGSAGAISGKQTPDVPPSNSGNLRVAHEPLDQFPLALQESGRCRCWERRLEPTPQYPNGERMNPYIYGHAVRCYLFIAICPRCGHSSGTHHWKCKFWEENPDQQPF